MQREAVILGMWSAGISQNFLKELYVLREEVWEDLWRDGSYYARVVRNNVREGLSSQKHRVLLDKVLKDSREEWEERGKEAWVKIREASGYVVFWDDEFYPERLKQQLFNPLLFVVQGHPIHLHGALVSIAGTRKASKVGKTLVIEMVEALADLGWSIASNGSMGIDRSALTRALKRDLHPVVILPTGMGKYYPRKNAKLFDEIREQGALIYMEPPQSKVYPSHLSLRNQMLAAMGRAVILVEAPLGSGSLKVAQAAQNIRCPVWIASGPALRSSFMGGFEWAKKHPRSLILVPKDLQKALNALVKPDFLQKFSKATETLAKEGFQNIQTIQDRDDKFNNDHFNDEKTNDEKTDEKTEKGQRPQTHKEPEIRLNWSSEGLGNLGKLEQEILKALGDFPKFRDELPGQSGMRDIALLNLELEGWIEPLPGGRYQRCPKIDIF